MAFLLSALVAHAESIPADPDRSKVPGERNKQGRIERPAETPELAPAALKLRAGEQLIYEIRVSGVPAGKAMLEVRKETPHGNEDGPLSWTVVLETRSNRAVSLFYDVRDTAKSVIDVKGGFSRFFYMDKREGEVKTEEKISTNYEIGTMEALYERLRGDQWRQHKLPLTTKVLDPLAAVYYMRSLDLKNLESIVLPICADRRVWNTRLVVKGRSLQSAAGFKDRECILIEPEAEFKGLFERKGRMQIWIDILTGIPLKMNVEVPIGAAEVILSQQKDSPLMYK
ncbi:MAG TPA: DUF3108 domain-containing protein [Planctomycetota bacterium]